MSEMYLVLRLCCSLVCVAFPFVDDFRFSSGRFFASLPLSFIVIYDIMGVRGYSSVGQSMRLIHAVSLVRVQVPPPVVLADYFFLDSNLTVRVQVRCGLKLVDNKRCL